MARTYATLGGVKFEIPAVEEITETVAWDYKQQETVAEKAVVQFAGAKARTMTLGIRLAASFCNPEQRQKDLEDKAKLISPLPLIFANGTLKGYFVIASLRATLKKTDSQGNVIASELQLELTESESGSAGSGGAAGGGAGGSSGGAAGLPTKPAAPPAQIQQSPLMPSAENDPFGGLREMVLQQQQRLTGIIPSLPQTMRIPGGINGI